MASNNMSVEEKHVPNCWLHIFAIDNFRVLKSNMHPSMFCFSFKLTGIILFFLFCFILTALFITVSSVPNRQVSCYLIMLSIPSCIVLKQCVLDPLFNPIRISHHKLKYIISKLLAALLYLWLCRCTNHFEVRKLTDLRAMNINNIILTLTLIVIITKDI